jgi:Trypsin-co-occurring domain 1
MGTFVEVYLADGRSLIVESQPDSDQSVVLAGSAQTLVDKASETFELALERITYAADTVVRKVTSRAEAPQEVTVEFAVKLASEIGVVIANSSAEANLKVTLRWGREGRP